jgi:hypothetical protein
MGNPLRSGGGFRPTAGREIAGKTQSDRLSQSKWNDETIARYHAWITRNGLTYVGREDFRANCADFAIVLLVTFSKLSKLPISFEKGSLKNESWFSDRRTLLYRVLYGGELVIRGDPAEYDRLLEKAKFWIQATDLYYEDRGDTVAKPVGELLPGDLLVGPIPSWHTQVVLSSMKPQPRVIKAQDFDGQQKQVRVLEVLQGSTQGAEQSATKITHKAWDIDSTDLYKNVGPGPTYTWVFDGTRSGASPFAKIGDSAIGLKGRRWDFWDFNRLLQLQTDHPLAGPGGHGSKPLPK